MSFFKKLVTAGEAARRARINQARVFLAAPSNNPIYGRYPSDKLIVFTTVTLTLVGTLGGFGYAKQMIDRGK
ncbi:hypothetical protein BC833DRAFT_617538 [Globomyces pollinis-pini]|nr:hypothetical protein BC833DRAFT_617538 [Globomyces pollinis-pini]